MGRDYEGARWLEYSLIAIVKERGDSRWGYWWPVLNTVKGAKRLADGLEVCSEKKRLWARKTRQVKRLHIEIGKVVERLSLGKKMRSLIWTYWVWDVYYIPKWSCWVCNLILEFRFQGKVYGWRYKLLWVLNMKVVLSVNQLDEIT